MDSIIDLKKRLDRVENRLESLIDFLHENGRVADMFEWRIKNNPPAAEQS